jgi:hypothetical protein
MAPSGAAPVAATVGGAPRPTLCAGAVPASRPFVLAALRALRPDPVPSPAILGRPVSTIAFWSLLARSHPITELFDDTKGNALELSRFVSRYLARWLGASEPLVSWRRGASGVARPGDNDHHTRSLARHRECEHRVPDLWGGERGPSHPARIA